VYFLERFFFCFTMILTVYQKPPLVGGVVWAEANASV
jgi:hypothetical protein